MPGWWVGPYVGWVPVDFLSDAVVARYGRFDGPPERVELEKIFFWMARTSGVSIVTGVRGVLLQGWVMVRWSLLSVAWSLAGAADWSHA